MRKFSGLALAAAAMIGCAGVANATPSLPTSTYAWSSTFADTGNTGGNNSVNFTGSFSHPSYNANLSSTSPAFSDASYLTICETNQSYGTGTDNISVSFTFTKPGAGTGTVTGTDQVSNITFYGYVIGTTGKISWANSGVADIMLAGGAEVQVTLADSSGWDSQSYNGCQGECSTVGATIKVLHDPSTAVPEPASITLLGGSLIGLGAFVRSRRSV